MFVLSKRGEVQVTDRARLTDFWGEVNLFFYFFLYFFSILDFQLETERDRRWERTKEQERAELADGSMAEEMSQAASAGIPKVSDI